MNKLRTASAVVGAVAAVAIGGAAFAAGADDPSPAASAADDRGGAVELLPDGTVVPSESADSASADSTSADDNPSADDSAPSSAGASPSSAAPSPSVTSALSISIDRAKAIALRVAGGGYVESVEGETEHGRAVWDVDVIRNGVEHDIDVDRRTGAVTRHRVDSGNGVESGSNGQSMEKATARATHDAGDDHGGRGSDDKGGDKAGGHGSDDRGGDDHGGHGSDD